MDNRIRFMLHLLDEQIQICENCVLNENGIVKPYWTEHSKYMIIGEGPSELEVNGYNHFIGQRGKMFWKIMAEEGFTKNEFLIMNSVQCRVVKKGNKTGKPSVLHRKMCKSWIEKYFRILLPEKILLFGNFAINSIMGEWGLEKFYKNDTLMTENKLFGSKVKIIRSYSPGSIIYEPSREKDLRRSIRLLRS